MISTKQRVLLFSVAVHVRASRHSRKERSYGTKRYGCLRDSGVVAPSACSATVQQIIADPQGPCTALSRFIAAAKLYRGSERVTRLSANVSDLNRSDELRFQPLIVELVVAFLPFLNGNGIANVIFPNTIDFD
jgi:hypothetical protein